MKSTKRHAASAAGLLALTLVSTPIFAQSPAQRGGPPVQDTPYILVATFQSADRKLGVDAADEVRKRIQSEHQAKELYAVPKTSINNTLEASGYRPDSALNASDLMELSKQLHGEYVVDGKATKSASGGVHLETRILMRTGQVTLAQPLPPVDGKDAGDAAKGVEKEITEALKGMPAYTKCTNDLRAVKYDDAAKDARVGIQAYPNSSLNRLCLLSAYAYNKAPADSVVSLSNAILAIDPTSMLALQNLAQAYATKGDTANAIATNLKIYRIDPTNSAVVESIVNQLAQSGAPDKALPMIDSLLVNDPANANMIRTKWLLQLRAKQYKAAIATGEQLAKIDTTVANLDYYNRQIGAAQADSNAAMVQTLAAKAAQKFPTDPSFPLLLAQNYRKAGQLQQALASARRATTIDPKNSNAWLFAIVTANDLNQSDSVLAFAQQALAAGADKAQIGQALLAPVGAAVKKAQDSKERADWESALKVATTVDAAAPSPATKFYVGLASFQVGLDALQNVQKLGKEKGKDAKDQACSETKVAEDQWATAQMSIPAGAEYQKEAAGQIMGTIQQYSTYIPQMKKSYCGAK